MELAIPSLMLESADKDLFIGKTVRMFHGQRGPFCPAVEIRVPMKRDDSGSGGSHKNGGLGKVQRDPLQQRLGCY